MSDAILAMDLRRLQPASTTFAWVIDALSLLDTILLTRAQVEPVARALAPRSLRLQRCDGGAWLVMGCGGAS